MIRARVPLGKFVTEYSVRNKGNEDIPVYSVTNSQGFCTEYFGKEVASQDKTTYKIVPQGYFAYNPSRINVGSVDWQRKEERAKGEQYKEMLETVNARLNSLQNK